MKLIADSGSSKTHWCLIQDQGDIVEYHTIGFNPFFVTEDIVTKELDDKGFRAIKNQVKEILFYGAGCSNIERNQFLQTIFSQYFTSAETITVDHDMLGACIALFNQNEGIACILGTGSNSCVYDGKNITQNVAALGYILGDEAGGAYFGKEILKHYIYKTVPKDIYEYMSLELKLDKEDIFNAIYKEALPNRYMASFSTIFSKFRTHEFIQNILMKGFDEFIQYHILCYPESKKYPIGMVGSIAFHFREEIERALKRYDLKLHTVLKSPIEGIVKYKN